MIKTNHRTIQKNFHIGDELFDGHPSIYESTNIRSQLSISWAKAKDFYVFDKKGNKWIDLTSGIFAMNCGHSNTFVNDAIKKQLDADLSFAFLYHTEIRAKLAQKILEISPDHFEKVAFLNTGSEATDTAYKIIKYWAKNNNRKYIICFNGSYHGRVLTADLMSNKAGNSSWANVKDDSIVFIDFPY